jgi:hypothetical protein
MGFQVTPASSAGISLSCPPHQVYEMLVTDEDRACFWAEEAVERDGHIQS